MLGYVVLWAILLNSVSEARTPFPVCGQYEEFRQCGPACPPTCDTLGEEVCCEVKCVQGCQCVDGRIRAPNGKCVAFDACPKPGNLQFEKLELTVLEGSKVAVLTVVRVKGSHGRITVRWRVREALKSYSELTGLLTFEDEVLTQTISIPITDNDVREADIIIHIELYEPSKKVTVEPRRGVSAVTIKDDDMRPGYPEMESLSVSVSESAGLVSVKIIRIDGTDGRLTASWKTVPGTAEAGGDFFTASGKVIFEDGIKEQIIKIKIKDDEVREGREEFRVELFDASSDVLNFRARGSRLATLVNIEDDDMTPGYPEMALTEVRVSEADRRVLIRVVRRDGSDGTITIQYRVVQVTAKPFVDYIPTEGVLEFKEGVTEQTITVELVDDSLREPVEKFRVELYNPAAGPGVIKFRARGTTLVTDVVVTDDDMTPGVLELERSTHSVTERVEALRIWVHRVGGADGVVSVRWRTVAGVAIAAKDFVGAEGMLVFLDGEVRKSFLVHIVDDNSREGTEIFHVDIYEAKAGPGVLNFKGLGQRTRTDITIQDDDMTPGQLLLEQSTLEVLENVGTVNLAVVRKDGTDGEVRVHWRTSGEGSYFMTGHGELVFAEGVTRREISITILDNEIRNIEKRFFEVELYDPTAGPGVVNFRGLGGITKVVINVKDDDAHPGQLELEESSFTVIQGVPTVTAVVNRVGGTDGRIVVHWRTVSSVATFVSVTGQIVFEEGQTRQEIQVLRPAGDFEIELFDLRPELEVVGFRGLGNRVKTVVRLSRFFGIVDLEESSYVVTEAAGSVAIGVVRSNGSEGEVRVRFRTVSITAEEGKDFVGTSGELVFHQSQHLQIITIRIVDDNVNEPTETFAVELLQVTASTFGVVDFRGLGNVVRTEITITDDDRATEPSIFFVNTTLEVNRNDDSVVFKIARTDIGLDQPLPFFIETLRYNGQSSAIPGADYKNIRGQLTFEPLKIAVSSMVRLLPANPSNRAPFKVFVVRISTPFGRGNVIPGSDILQVILKDVEALFLQGQGEVNVKVEVEPPPPPPEFRGGGKTEVVAEKCPAGLTFKECAPSCQKKCQGANNVPPPCHRTCVKGCFCPEGMWLDEANMRCVTQCPVVAEKCPAGLTFKECAPSCQKKCQGANNPPPPCHRTCVKGCFCPEGMWLDEANMRCVTQCPVSKCPFGLTFKECASACPETCPGLDFLNQNPSCHSGGCIKGCYCPVGKVLDHTLKNCVSPTQCTGGQGLSPRGLQVQGSWSSQGSSQVQGGLQGQIQGQVQGRGLPIGGLQNTVQGQVQGATQGGGLLGGVGGGLLNG